MRSWVIRMTVTAACMAACLVGPVAVRSASAAADPTVAPVAQAGDQRVFVEFSGGNGLVVGGDTLDVSVSIARVWSEFLGATGITDMCGVVDCRSDSGRIDKIAFRSAAAVTLTPLTRTVESAVFRDGHGNDLSDHEPVAAEFHWTTHGS